MLLGEIFELVQLLFVVGFTVFLANCVDYDILFANKFVNHTDSSKVTLPDAFLPVDVCSTRIRDNAFVIFVLIISGSELPYVTWQEVQARIVEIQKEHQICIHKKELSELDIYHRILRFKNYMVAMVNKSLLPMRFRPPLLGECVFYTRGLKYNFELIFFWGPGSLFGNEWSLKAEYKRGGNRQELADRLASRILWIGIANLLLCPVILVWQILYAFFSYTEDVQRREQRRHHHGGACRGGLVVGERRRARRGRWRDERVSLVAVVVVVGRAPSSLRSPSPRPRSAEFLQEVLFLQRG
ncbi:hypothetical protein CRUP_006320 [Coryphaenoides rupestris]|nr:hypothetical protein CRUP_006320 [Coryphaenoides rupestris]